MFVFLEGGKAMKNQEELLQLIYADEWMMDILRTARALALPDWWVCAGFVRSKIWDTLHHFSERTKLPDVDVIYFDPDNVDESEEKKLEEQLKKQHPSVPWSVKNQARMHVINNLAPYTSSIDAIAKFPETATALGLRLDADDQLMLAAPHGIEDVLTLVLKPTPVFLENRELHAIYQKRVQQKNWKAIWHRISIHDGFVQSFKL